MEYETVVYYTFCTVREILPKEYKKYQRKIAGKMLAYGFEAEFAMEFDSAHVKKDIHGKPFWSGTEDVYFNVSNTQGLVVCAVSNMETGVDAELIRFVKDMVMKRCCTQAESAYIMGKPEEYQRERINERFFQLWTLKESFIKMTGQGMLFPIRDAEFSIHEEEQNLKISCSQSGYFSQKRLGDYWISLCTSKESKVVWKELTLKELLE